MQTRFLWTPRMSVLGRFVRYKFWRYCRVLSGFGRVVTERTCLLIAEFQRTRLSRALAPVIRAVAIDRLSRRQQKIVAAGGAVCAQLFFVLLLVIGGRAIFVRPPAEVDVMIGGTWGSPEATTKPPEIMPEVPTIVPPEFEISDVAETSAEATPGMANVSRPAQAIAEAHMFPPAPPAYRTGGPHTVTLLISVTEVGSVASAAVQSSSGIAELDGMALAWVKKHWRYLPALRNGVAVGVTTTAIVTFTNA